jgi:hypothetical protein
MLREPMSLPTLRLQNWVAGWNDVGFDLLRRLPLEDNVG